MSTGIRLAPWQVHLADFGSPVGHEQGGVRPAIVVGSARHCAFPTDTAMVVPLTTRDRGFPHHVRIASRGAGLRAPSWARTEDLETVSTARFVRPEPLGAVSADEAAELSMWLREMVAF